MAKRPYSDVMWTASREGQDWRDESVLAAVNWLTSLIPHSQWKSRADATEAHFESAKRDWSEGRRVPLFDPKDEIAWYIHQAKCYANPKLRPNFFEPIGYRIAPILKRIGEILPILAMVKGSEERAERLMLEGRSQPDDTIYELLVAGAYKLRGWDNVEFVPEMPGVAKRPDLFVDRRNAHWAIECKRAGRSGYARDERMAGERIANFAHRISKQISRPLIAMIRFNVELKSVPEDYLGGKLERFIAGSIPYEWSDEIGLGGIDDAFGGSLLRVLQTDDIYFGSSRMIQLILGRYDQSVDYSMDGDWIPADGRPFHATWVNHASLVAWTSQSPEAARRKAQHFRGVVGRASEQLPGDRPGAIHVGYEAVGGNSVDGMRHRLNLEQMRTFDPEISRLRWVYGNYFMPEHVTDQNESAAISETMAWYRVQKASVDQPLPGHLLFGDQEGRDGAHFSR